MPATPKKIPGKNDFFWSNEMEPHAIRKRELLKKYGKEINKLMAPEPMTKFVAVGVVSLHLAVAAYAIQVDSWITYLLLAYVMGASCAHNLFLAIHEISHYAAFKSKFLNDLLAIFCNVPIVIPYAMYFKEYHYEHHRYMGWDGVDQDIPTEFEAKLMASQPGKFIFLLFQGFFYALRPVFMRPLPMTPIRALNYGVVLITNYCLYQLFGLQIIGYLLLSLLLGTGINPFAGHFISEHYILDKKERQGAYQDSHSYYGWLNIFSYNVGYHNEHHDFPSVPWTKLPALKALAPEYYEPLNKTPSWFGAQMQFLFDPAVNQWCRVLREKGAGSRKGELLPTTSDTKTEGRITSCDNYM